MKSDSLIKVENRWGHLFDQLKKKEGLSSDAMLAQSLGITRSFISSVRNNRKSISAELGKRIFLRLGKRIVEEDLPIFMPLRMQPKKFELLSLHNAKLLIFQRAKGKCELCKRPAPFMTKDGMPYLEIHHIVPVFEGGLTSAENLVALCPNCHRKMEICPTEMDIRILIKRVKPKKNVWD